MRIYYMPLRVHFFSTCIAIARFRTCELYVWHMRMVGISRTANVPIIGRGVSHAYFVRMYIYMLTCNATRALVTSRSTMCNDNVYGDVRFAVRRQCKA